MNPLISRISPSSPSSIDQQAQLNDGKQIPWLGLGVYRSPAGKPTVDAVKTAIACGYRHIDTASFYANEKEVGQAVRECGLPREKIFVTTKLWNDDQGYDRALRAFDRSSKLLNIDAIDLYLIHWPVPGLRLESWKALVRLQNEKRVHSIGVSNFMIPHLEELFKYSEVRPVINQVEMSPFLQQRQLREFCKKHGIVVEAYSPLTRGAKLQHPELAKIALKHKKTPAQIMIRWALEAEAVVIPKSNKPERIAENADVFDFSLDEEDDRALRTLDEQLHVAWDPTTIE